ncbi:MAG: sugar transferase, partial [Calditrichales bacterium]
TFSQDIPVVLKVSLIGILLGMSGAFLYRGFSYSRLVFLLIYFFVSFFLITERFFFHKLKHLLLMKNYDIRRVLVAGSTDLVANVLNHLSKNKSGTFKPVGYISDAALESARIPYLGNPDDLERIIRDTQFDGFILAFNHSDYNRTLQTLKLSEGRNLEIFYIPEILDLLTSHFTPFETDGLFLLQLKAFTLSGWQGFLKRIFDFCTSCISLIFLAPVFLILAVMVKFTSPGPVFYRQIRIGMDGKEFNMIKFRSMSIDAEAKSGPVWAVKNDARVTPIGSFLRRTSLDELPQLINVIRGDMSLVGPRPERPHFVDQFKSHIPQYAERHRVLSGVTGWAQVNGLRGQSPIEERTKYDLYYIENWSLWLDIKIIILTFIAIFKGENAY